MSLGDLLDNLFIKSLLVIYEAVLNGIFAVVNSTGWTLVCFSIVLNLVLLPVYFQMERAKEKDVQRRDAMNDEIARIKAHYTGRERYFYIRTIHRIFGYRPIAAVFSSADLYLQILIFATVYRYLSTTPGLKGVGFFSIDDLSRPDGLLLGLNALPILMTLLNMLSTAVYTEDKKKQRTGFGIAVLFLVLLYRSPSGVVLYWTCNNAFSLVRNFVERRVVPSLSTGTVQWLSRLANQQ